MNLLLLDPAEVDDHGEVTLGGERAAHLRDVLRARRGDRLRVGLIDGPLGEGEVIELSPDATDARLRCTFETEVPERGRDCLLLAIPRPRVLGRCLEHAAALGFADIVLFRCWRVEPGHLTARALRDEHVEPRLRLGLQQARRTQWPRVHRFLRFKPFVEDQLDGLAPAGGARFVAHPSAAAAVRDTPVGGAAPITLAIGPEGGFLPYEVDLLQRHGCQPVSAGPHPQRVEVALPLLFGQLDLRRQQS